MRKFGVFSTVIALAAIVAGWQPSLCAQTMWHFMGVPQTAKFLRNATINRRGNTPRLERKPVPKRIADPDNLESDNPAIKKAAEVKQQEDLKPQKIKALKYLATMGCGCYPGVAEAFMAALEDCTEDVRYEAAKAIQEAAGDVCVNCNQDGCCSEDLVKKLAERAFEVDDKGCPLEPSDRVRAELIAALQNCCRGAAPVIIEPEEKDEVLPPDPSPEDLEDGSEVAHASRDMASQMFPVGFRSPGSRKLVNRPVPPVVRKVGGHVDQVGSGGRQIMITHDRKWTASLGSEASVYHDFVLGAERVGTMRIVQAFPGSAIAVPFGQIRHLEEGDRVSLLVIDPKGGVAEPDRGVIEPDGSTSPKAEMLVITDERGANVATGSEMSPESDSRQLQAPKTLPMNAKLLKVVSPDRPSGLPSRSAQYGGATKHPAIEKPNSFELVVSPVIATDRPQPTANLAAPATSHSARTIRRVSRRTHPVATDREPRSLVNPTRRLPVKRPKAAEQPAARKAATDGAGATERSRNGSGRKTLAAAFSGTIPSASTPPRSVPLVRQTLPARQPVHRIDTRKHRSGRSKAAPLTQVPEDRPTTRQSRPASAAFHQPLEKTQAKERVQKVGHLSAAPSDPTSRTVQSPRPTTLVFLRKSAE